jgi:uncharacterized membrane protein SpoIIM required for sporulation
MHPEEFYQSRKTDWEQLNRVLVASEKDIKRLSPQDVETLGRLYRAVTSDLALAQRDFPRHQITQYLNRVVGRAHAVVYQGEALAFNRLLDFGLRGFPRLFRETLVFTVIAALFLIVPALIAGFSIAARPENATWLLSSSAQRLIPTVQNKELWIDIPVNERPYASSFIMTNNIQVSFLAFGSGVSGGLLTIWILVSNGLDLGGLLGLTAHYGIGFDLATFVIGHGVIELSVIFMAGGSGLMLGWALIHPGLQRRRDALALAARKAVRLLLGAVPMLVVAGTIEGLISPAENVPWPVKWSIGIVTGILLYSYLLLAGRERKDDGWLAGA